eukprot:comp20153_c0_seq1/m.39794 comp20153_c0_seq1/g.39794  ORF comp20153_c0_seq1/g.39794 comp20153_c0_seq1/m.39794 type:complete len:474 (-) comp20153_c0_seq1:23-1444(-)
MGLFGKKESTAPAEIPKLRNVRNTNEHVDTAEKHIGSPSTPAAAEDIVVKDWEEKNEDEKRSLFSRFGDKVKTKLGDGFDSLPVSFQDKMRGLALEAEELKEKLKLQAEQHAAQLRIVVAEKVSAALEKALDKAANVAKEKLKDEDMPRVVKRAVDGTVDGIMPEVKVEILEKVATTFRKTVEHDQGQPVHCCPNPFRKFRAVTLYALFPHDRTIWQQLRDPLYWLLQIPPAFPRWGVSQIWFILMLVLRDKRDEFQLVNYILGFKGFQFINVGVIPAIVGGFQMYFCAIKDKPTCDTDAPRIDYWELAFFTLQVFLMWIAYFLLPYSHKKGGPRYKFPTKEEEDPPSTPGCCGAQRYPRRGGKLGWFVAYDTLIFFGAAGLIAYAAFSGRTAILQDETARKAREWQTFASFYYAKLLYGLMSLPWLIFQLPLMLPIFTHAKVTRYNQNGVTVPRSKTIRRGIVTRAAEEIAN